MGRKLSAISTSGCGKLWGGCVDQWGINRISLCKSGKARVFNRGERYGLGKRGYRGTGQRHCLRARLGVQPRHFLKARVKAERLPKPQEKAISDSDRPEENSCSARDRR